MKKALFATTVALVVSSSSAFASIPYTDIGIGDFFAGVGYRSLKSETQFKGALAGNGTQSMGSQNVMEANLGVGLPLGFAATMEYSKFDAKGQNGTQSLKSYDFAAHKQIALGANVMAGYRQLEGDSNDKYWFVGAAISQHIGKVGAYGSYKFLTDGSKEWIVGGNYALDKNLWLDVNYKNSTYEIKDMMKLTNKGLGFGVTYKF